MCFKVIIKNSVSQCTGSQCRDAEIGVMEALLLDFVSSLAAAF